MKANRPSVADDRTLRGFVILSITFFIICVELFVCEETICCCLNAFYHTEIN